NGAKGDPGTNGTNGTDGAKGADGSNGVSVSSAAEPAGANCANGGSQFTAANNNITYACNGTKGDTGDKGDPGPANLDALQGSPCALDGGSPGKLVVSVSSSTGEVSMACLYEVSASVSGGTLHDISISDFTDHLNRASCSNANSCTWMVPKGH